MYIIILYLQISLFILLGNNVYNYSIFTNIAQQLTQRLHEPDYDAPRLKSLLQKIYSRHHDLY
jgi:Fe2+ transport system protein B